MAKKKPSWKNIRQGQTIYMVDSRIDMGQHAVPEVRKYFLYSQKESLPPDGCVIERLPVSLLRKYLKEYSNRDHFFSRKKAVTAMRLHHAY